MKNFAKSLQINLILLSKENFDDKILSQAKLKQYKNPGLSRLRLLTKMTQNLNSIILASKSPRRSQLLQQAGIDISIIPAHINEASFPQKDPMDFVKKLSLAKAMAIAEKFPDNWVIGADTIVLIENKILGKPKSYEHAFEMLDSLNGREHKVITGFSICNKNQKKKFCKAVVTNVWFKKASKEEIQWYINTQEPFDKAGAYGIQGKASFLIEKINGSHSNVVGLPICEVIDILTKQGIIERK